MKVQVAANHVENFLITRHANELTMEAFKTLKAYCKGIETKTERSVAKEKETAKSVTPTATTSVPQQKKKPPMTKLWTPEEEEKLKAEFSCHLDAETMARVHERTIGGIAARLVKLGCIKERSDLPGYDEYEAARIEAKGAESK